jgi:hypothetical protein
MPQIFKIGSYLIYFWSDEGSPLEPIHVHVAEGVPTENATKIWITSNHNCLLCHNKSDIPNHKLKKIMEIIAARNKTIEEKWFSYFNEISYYC